MFITRLSSNNKDEYIQQNILQACDRALIVLIYQNIRKAVVYTLLFCKFTPPQGEGVFTYRES